MDVTISPVETVANERQIRRAIARADSGRSLSPAEAETLLWARGDDLVRLMDVAGRVRDQGLAEVGLTGHITYSPKVFIPLTRLCRDRCGYCTFATDPASLRRAGEEPFLSPDEVLRIAGQGAEAGCSEALFTMGEAPEKRWPAAGRWLAESGFDSTHEYLRASAIGVLEQTGLLPHLNPGVLGWRDLRRLRPVAPSMGMMLETTSRRLFETPGEVHHGSPDKDPAVRLRVLEDAGRNAIPFTTGVLVGIGETKAELVDSILAIRTIGREFGHIQEVLVQNFRAKPRTAAANREDLDQQSYLAAIATTRVLLGPSFRVQAPPNLSDPDQFRLLIRAGVDDFGGISPVTPDHVNPERPWPSVSALAAGIADTGFDLVPRLTAHPGFVRDRQRWIDPRLHAHVEALAGPDGLRSPAARPGGRSWQEADPTYEDFARRSAGGRIDLQVAIDSEGRRSQSRGDWASVFGDWDQVSARVTKSPDSDNRSGAVRGEAEVPGRLSAQVRAGLRLAQDDPASLALPRHQEAAVALMSCEGAALTALCEIADDVRRDRVGDDVTYVVNRNLNFTNVCYTGCRFCAFAQRADDPDAFTLSLSEVGDRVDEAVAAGATEICMQGGIHPDLPGTAYFDLAAEVKRRQSAVHLHAFSPMEVINGATRSGMSIEDWLSRARAAGVDSIPGTAAEILDDDIRWVLTKGKLPTEAWIEVIETAHRVGLRSSSTMMYGHVDRPGHWVAHLRVLRRLQERTGGFTEFVPLPFVHQQAPIYLAGVSRPGPTMRDNLAVHAMARLMLDGAIDNIQCSWVKLGVDGCAAMLRAGANDLGGTLMEETISRMAGSTNGSSLTESQLHRIAAAAGRSARKRSTDYSLV